MILSLPLLLPACSAVGPRTTDGPGADGSGYLAFESRSLLAAPTDGDAGLLQGRIEAGSAEQVLRYNASYSLQSDALIQSLAADEYSNGSVPAELGRQSLRQELKLELPAALGAPVQIDVHNQQDLRWSFNGEARSDSQRAQLQWKPDFLALDLHWAPPRDVTVSGQALDCHLQANLRLSSLPMIEDSDLALDVSGQTCRIHAPARGVVGLAARSEALAWRWGRVLDNRLRLQRVSPEWQDFGLPAVEPAYELGLKQTLSRSGWQLGLDMAWRQVDQATVPEPVSTPARWAMNVMLSRDLGWVGLTARWLHANDPLWFVPLASPVERERLSLLLDFSKWLAQVLPDLDGKMSASLEHIEDARGVDDNQVKWNVQLTW
ncbi:MAG: hypothetical protein EA370_07855 [Wenzhouxiangella sp.]|nr:MAG: hypothetical protein EA370_07855 [Wenzhouxiangella sp.]